MIGLAALGAVLTYALIKKPKIKPGSYGSNNIVGYEVPPDAETEASGQSPTGRLAHERVEFRWAHIVGVALAVPFALFVDPPFSYAAPAVAIVANGVVRLMTNSWDFIGHNIEIMVAESEGREGYREQEINRMAHGEQRGMTPEQIDQRLRKWEWLARIAKVLA